MVCFVGGTPRLEIHYIESKLRTVYILGAYNYSLGPFDFEVDTGKAEAAFFAGLFSFGDFNDRIDENDSVLRFFLRAAIHYEEALQHSNLRSRQAHARSTVHGFEHVIDQSVELSIEYLNLGGPLGQDGVTVFHNIQDHRVC